MTIDPSSQPGAFQGRQPISEEEVLKLRRHVWADGSVSPDEAAQLFELNDAAQPSSEWSDFFIEAMCEYLIGRGQPRGYVTDTDAQWLIHHIGKDGRIDSYAELELIVKLLERADYVPETLKAFAMREVEQTVLTGRGPTRRGGEIQPGRIDDAECALLRRLVFAGGGDGPARVSQSEAEMLFRLKDATLKAENSADWQRLFVQGVANHLMAYQDYSAPEPDVAQRLAKPYDADPARMLGRLGREVARFEEVKAAIFGDEQKRIAEHDAAVAADAQVTGAEAGWLKRLFDGDGAQDALEQALLDFLAEDGIRPF